MKSHAPNTIKHPIDYKIIFWMLGIHILAFAALFMFSWKNFFIFLGLYFMTGCLGVTLGYHRLLTHRALKVPKFVERVLATCGVISMQGGPGEWVGHHRMHHAFSDTPKDPHNAERGFWFSHIGWLFIKVDEFDNPEILKKYARDVYADWYLSLIDSRYMMLLIQAMLAVVLYAVGGVGAVLWGIFLRLVVVYHVTWLVNSAAHMWGYQTHKVGDLARNNWFVALVAFGEGWHNNHHAHGDVAPAGYRWWEFDITFVVIRLLVLCRLAKDIKMPPKEVTYDSMVVMPKRVIRPEKNRGITQKPAAAAV